MRDFGALTELLLTRLKKVEVPKIYVSLCKRLMENKPAGSRQRKLALGENLSCAARALPSKLPNTRRS